MVEYLDRYGGWPVVKGNDWQSASWNWLDMSKRISRDGLDNLILEVFVSTDLKNTDRRILSVSFSFDLKKNQILSDFFLQFADRSCSIWFVAEISAARNGACIC